MAVKLAGSSRRRTERSGSGRRYLRWLVPLAACLACAGLWWCYARLSATLPGSSDAASNALEAWDMVHGNWLLRGWTLTDVSFYTTELPEYGLVELVRGLGPEVLHVAPALTYTLLIAVAGLLAGGRARGAEGWGRALIAAGIMVAPQLGNGVHVLLAQPDHAGTQVLILGTFLLLDRYPRRWFTPPAVFALLALATVADKITIVDAVVPLAFCGLLHAVWTRRPAAHRFELSLAVAAGLATGAALAALDAIDRAGGFALLPVRTGLTGPGGVTGHLSLAWHGVLSLFGADVTDASPGFPTVLAWLHAPGVALAVAAFAVVAWRVPSRHDLVGDVLAVAIVVNLAGFVASVIPTTAFDTREIVALLPYGAVLAGRVFGRWLAGPRPCGWRPYGPPDPVSRWRARLARVRPGAVALAVAGACQLAALSHGLTAPPATDPEQALAGWLQSHGLTRGIGTFNDSNLTTLDSGGAVRLVTVSWLPPAQVAWHYPRPPYALPSRAAVLLRPHLVAVPRSYQSPSSWYDPRSQQATFIVSGTGEGTADLIPRSEILTLAGPPASTYEFQSFTIMVWPFNLLPLLSGPPTGVPGDIGHP